MSAAAPRTPGRVAAIAETPWNTGYIESFNKPATQERLNRNHWNTLFKDRAVIGEFKNKNEHNHDTGTEPWVTGRRPNTLPDVGAPTPRWRAGSTESETRQPDSSPRWTQ